MSKISQPQSQRNSNQSRGADARANRGNTAKNKDTLKSDRTSSMAANPAAQKDQFGSRHNADHVKKEQRRTGRPGFKSDSAFRESAQDTRTGKGAKNRQPGRRSKSHGN
jgi:hypothetical protein